MKCGQELHNPPNCVTRICGQKAKFPSCLGRRPLYHAVISCHQYEKQASINCDTCERDNMGVNTTGELNK